MPTCTGVFQCKPFFKVMYHIYFVTQIKWSTIFISFLSYVLLKFLSIALQSPIFPISPVVLLWILCRVVILRNACHIIADLTLTVESQDQENLRRNWFHPFCLGLGENALPTPLSNAPCIPPPGVRHSWPLLTAGSSGRAGQSGPNAATDVWWMLSDNLKCDCE